MNVSFCEIQAIGTWIDWRFLKLVEYKECFSLYDRDGDGAISVEQLKLVMRSLERCPTQTDINTIAKKLGINCIFMSSAVCNI